MNRWYLAVSCDNTVPNPLIVDMADLGIAPERLDAGKQVEDWTAFAWMRASRPENDGTPDDVLQNHLGLPVYSARLRNALERAGIRGVQYLPVKVLRPAGEIIDGYCIANIVERRAALDFARSDYDVFPDDYFLPERRGKVRGIRRVTLRAEKLEGCEIFKLDEFAPSIYMSESFKTTFEAGGFTGYSFREVSVI